MAPARVLSEEETKQKVYDQISWDSRLSSSSLTVNVTGSKVVLSGTVPSVALRQIAERDVKAVPGVEVINEIAVKYPAGAVTPDDAALEENIRNLLRLNADIDESRIAVKVVAGNVILEGAVDSFWQKVKTEATAADLRGINHIFNKLVVTPSRDVLDEVIAEDIESALDRTLSVDINQINVSVDKGIVTISGSVPDRVSCHAAEEITQFTRGVKGMHNNLIIQPKPSD